MASADPAALPPFTGTLTPEHLAVVHAERDRWLRIGLSTTRADRPAAEAAVRRAYQAAGFQPPIIVVWTDSPLGGCLATATLRQFRGHRGGRLNGDQLRGRLDGHQLGRDLLHRRWGRLGDELWHQLQRQLRGQLGSKLQGQLWGQLGDQLHSQLYERLKGQLDDRLRGHLGGKLWGQLQGQLDHQLQIELYDQLHLQLGITLEGQLREQLGSQIDWQVGDPLDRWQTITVDQIRREDNAEVRRVMLDRYGHARFLRDAGAQRAHTDDTGTLWRCRLPDDEDLLMVEVTNATPEPDGTARTYWLQVPPDVRTARQAVAWTFGLDEGDYHPKAQT
jgi:hypothetical protein